MTTTEAPATISAGDRTEILGFASWLLSIRGREAPEAVLTAAAPLLEWAGQAAGKDDRTARMSAMRRAHNNGSRPRSPQEFLAEARAYYQFITETA